MIHGHVYILEPPTNVRLGEIDVGQGLISFIWDSATSDCHNVSYAINTTNCGRCPYETENTVATCSEVIFDGRVCIFEVITVVCGDTHGLNLSIPLVTTPTGIYLSLIHI